MKTNFFKSLTLKGMFTKVALAGALAGAVFMAAPQKAEAQRIAVGVQFGHPYYGRAYYGPAYRPYYRSYYAPAYGPGFYAHERWGHEYHRGYYR